jgi:hypothetical protein
MKERCPGHRNPDFRYQPKKPFLEAGKPSPDLLGQPGQQPPKGEIQPNASGQPGEESTAPQPRKPRRRGFRFAPPIPFYSEAELEELRKKYSKQNSSD